MGWQLATMATCFYKSLRARAGKTIIIKYIDYYNIYSIFIRI